MFKFGFSDVSLVQDSVQDEHERIEKNVDWFAASEVIVLPEQINRIYDCNEYEEYKRISDISLNIIRSDKAVVSLTDENSEVITEAESQNSDIIPAKYEGGLKVWEGTHDLTNYILEKKFSLKNKTVLDLGCGAGVIGILCLLKGSKVHFQDYNVEVIRSVTIPNVILNLGNAASEHETTKFYCGDWESFTSMLSKNINNENKKYDFIFTSETIYNPDNHQKLYNVFKQHLKPNGVGLIAGKTYYFGVGGSMRQFEELVIKDRVFKVQVVWRSDEGLQREILALSRE